MACAKQWFNVVGAGLCGVGSGIGIFAGGGTPATVGAVIATLGSISWLISGLMDLRDCLRAAGLDAQADLVDQELQALISEHDRVQGLVGSYV